MEDAAKIMKGLALVVDDHPLVARGMAEYLTTHCGFAGARSVSGSADCLKFIESEGVPDFAVVDFWLPEGAALPLLRQLSVQWPGIRLLAVSGDEDVGVRRKAQEAGAHGFLRKHEAPEVFARAVAALRAGQSWFPLVGGPTLPPDAQRELPIHPQELGLTDRQGEVLALMLRGLPNKQIARQLNLSETTVKEHVTNILARLGVANRVAAITRLRGRRIEA
jgi:DNA-binding NarL/FixJ family response regulator